MTLAAFMADCLNDPEHGYYTTRDPLGAAGDFVTAPEISQMFGEMIGLWLAAVWQGMGRPAPLRLVELGPGRGTLMADALRAARASGLSDAADLWLVETSPALRAAQAERLAQAQWAADIGAVPPGPMLLVANEFFDALPVREFVASPEGWHERLVGLEGDRLVFGLSPPLPRAEGETPQGWRALCPAMERIAGTIAARIAADGGAALIVDYGYEDRAPPGPTLQAVRDHRPADPLSCPGEADLTCLVDFRALARALAGLDTATAEQGAFLARLGIGARAAALAAARPDAAGTVADALERLTAPEAMGTLFRVLAAWPQGAKVPPGFEDAP